MLIRSTVWRLHGKKPAPSPVRGSRSSATRPTLPGFEEHDTSTQDTGPPIRRARASPLSGSGVAGSGARYKLPATRAKQGHNTGRARLPTGESPPPPSFSVFLPGKAKQPVPFPRWAPVDPPQTGNGHARAPPAGRGRMGDRAARGPAVAAPSSEPTPRHLGRNPPGLARTGSN